MTLPSIPEAIASCGVSHDEGLNLLQDRGIISDLCITVDDVATQDAERAVRWLMVEFGKSMV